VLLLLALVAMAWGHRQNKRLARANLKLEAANALLAETRLQLANETEAERRRIARDLHDQTLADLRRLMMLTDRMPAGVEGDGQVQPAALRAEIETVSTEIRRICEALSPSALVNLGLAAALEWAMAEAAASQPRDRKFEYVCELDPRTEEKIDPGGSTAIQIYRIAQEAIGNVCKHAEATRVRLSWTVGEDGALLLTVEDNGKGFDFTRPHPSGRGLANIRSRASLIEAAAAWNARTGGGSVFTLRL
jgi:signal transduction histidine kinase